MEISKKNLSEIITSTITEALGSADSQVELKGVADSQGDVAKVGQELAKKAVANGARTAKISITTKDSTVGDNVEVTGKGDSVSDTLKDAVNDVNQSGMNRQNVAYTVQVDGSGRPIHENEGLSLTKREIVEAIKKEKSSDMKQTIKVTESQLCKVLEESVKNVLKEVSIDTLGRASAEADARRRFGQRDTFNKGISDEFTHRFPDIKEATPDYIKTKRGFVLRADGGGADGTKLFGPEAMAYSVSRGQFDISKSAARGIAEWCKHFYKGSFMSMDDVCDWHNWATL